MARDAPRAARDKGVAPRAKLVKTATKKSAAKKNKPSYFWGVKSGRQPGVYTSAERADVQVTGFSGAKSKRFKSRVEAEAYMHGDSESNKVCVSGLWWSPPYDCVLAAPPSAGQQQDNDTVSVSQRNVMQTLE
jgi:Caulimovirus viroplasmin